MINIIDKKDCSGCHACMAICPFNCIEMIADQEGFLYPKVNKKICTECNRCENVCPVLRDRKTGEPPKAYAGWCHDENIRLDSSSGGVFSVLMKHALIKNGIVFGAAFDNSFTLCHQYAQNENDCKKFRGSKYLQSVIGDVFHKAKEYLQKGRFVLFSGTPCQVAGLYSYLGKDYNNLLTCDLVCHGVPSPKVFFAYKKLLEKKYNSVVKSISFRSKVSGWRRFSLLFKFFNNKEYRKVFDDDPFMNGFLNNIFLRPSCHDCKFSSIPRVADISLADYWGVWGHHPEWDDDKGTSLILVQTEKGKNILDACQNEMYLFETDLNVAILSNSCIIGSVMPNENRMAFFSDFNNLPVEVIIKKYMSINILRNNNIYRIKKLLKVLLKINRIVI